MVNQQVLSEKWHEIKGELKKRWDELSDDDLHLLNGDIDQLAGRIQQKTGESREVIEQFLGQFAEEGSEFFAGVRDRLEEVTGRTMEGARDGYESLRRSYSGAERIVQEQPGKAVAMAFGLGLFAGVGVALLLKDRSSESRLAQGRSAAEQFGKQMMETMMNMIPEFLAKHQRD